MRNLIRRFSRVADSSSQMFQLRSGGDQRSRSYGTRSTVAVPEGHFPVYVGEEMERFVVSADLLNYPIFVNLLNKSAQEYGYKQKGVLRIPCNVVVFERILQAVYVGDASPAARDLDNSLSD